jgi:hypothetical protein
MARTYTITGATRQFRLALQQGPTYVTDFHEILYDRHVRNVVELLQFDLLRII